VHVAGTRQLSLRTKLAQTEVALLQHVLHGHTPRTLPRQVLHIYPKRFTNHLNSYNYDHVTRWTRTLQIFDLEKIFFPIHIRNHWTLAVVHIPTQQVQYYDSMSDDEGIPPVRNLTITNVLRRNSLQGKPATMGA